MKNTKIAVAQISSVDGNVTENIAVHMNAIEKAVSVGVSYIVFPELSLTGYQPECASNLAFTVNDGTAAYWFSYYLSNRTSRKLRQNEFTLW